MDNQPGRAVVLGAEFRNLVQGDLSVDEYSRRLKSLADALEDVGEHIFDQALTLQLIRGLNRKFQIMATLLPMQSSFPSFVQARSSLLMEEISANERARLDGRPELPAAALTIGHTPSGGPSPSPDRGSGSDSANKSKGPAASSPGDRGSGSCRRGRGRGRGRGAQSSGGAPAGRSAAPAGPHPPTGFFAPYNALLPGLPAPRAPWAAPNAAGVLGPCPPAPHQAYTLHSTPSSGPTWEQYNQLYAALQGLSMQQQHAGGTPDWFLDTGATSHVAGPSHGEANHEVQ